MSLLKTLVKCVKSHLLRATLPIQANKTMRILAEATSATSVAVALLEQHIREVIRTLKKKLCLQRPSGENEGI